jgi:hypothetical protein
VNLIQLPTPRGDFLVSENGHSRRELYRRIALLERQVAGLEDDVRYWTSLPRRVRRYFFARYDRAHPLGIERLT